MRFFFDRCAPIAIARMVQGVEAGAPLLIRHHDEDRRFVKTTTDVEWIITLREDGDPLWIIVSGDGNVLKNRVERAVLDEAGLPFFCLEHPWPSFSKYDYAWRFMKVWPEIVAHAKRQKGRIFRVRAGSSMKVETID